MKVEDISIKKAEFEYKTLVSLKNLNGIFSIWNFAFTANKDSVVNLAIEFLANLYINVSEDLKDN